MIIFNYIERELDFCLQYFVQKPIISSFWFTWILTTAYIQTCCMGNKKIECFQLQGKSWILPMTFYWSWTASPVFKRFFVIDMHKENWQVDIIISLILNFSKFTCLIQRHETAVHISIFSVKSTSLASSGVTENIEIMKSSQCFGEKHFWIKPNSISVPSILKMASCIQELAIFLAWLFVHKFGSFFPLSCFSLFLYLLFLSGIFRAIFYLLTSFLPFVVFLFLFSLL